MNMKIVSVENPGDLERERVVMRSTKDVGLGYYAVFHCGSVDGVPLGAHIDSAYWFGNLEIKAGDLVILYTKQGPRSKKDTGDGKTSHFFYWGLKAPIWGTDKMAVLVETAAWDYIEEDDATLEPRSTK